jgi:hypothetical protein
VENRAAFAAKMAPTIAPAEVPQMIRNGIGAAGSIISATAFNTPT